MFGRLADPNRGVGWSRSRFAVLPSDWLGMAIACLVLMLMHRFAALLFVAASLLASTPARALTHAEPISADQEPSVATFAAPGPFGEMNPMCAGVLIASDVILTAAHCVAREAAGDPRATLVVILGGRRLPVREVRLHPGYRRAGLHCDLALVRLREPVAIAPVALDRGPPGLFDRLRLLRIVGFGPDGDDDEAVRIERRGLVWPTASSLAEIRLATGPSHPCAGDSGAPLLLRDAAGDRVVAVISRGTSGCRTATAIRVAAYLDDFLLPTLDRWRHERPRSGA